MPLSSALGTFFVRRAAAKSSEGDFSGAGASKMMLKNTIVSAAKDLFFRIESAQHRFLRHAQGRPRTAKGRKLTGTFLAS